MDFGVIRNKKQALELSERIKQRRLPFKFALQDIYPLRSLDANSYYWGIVLKMIADETGQSIEQCHEAFKREHNFRWDFIFNSLTETYEFTSGVDSTTVLDDKEFWDYIMKIRVEAEVDLHITIPLPNECFVPELNYDHDKIELRKM